MKAIAQVFMALMLTTLTAQSLAAPLYKCDIGGSLVFQDSPCPPINSKQKIACPDIDGYAVYRDSMSGECKNLPAGTAKNNDFAGKKATTKTKSAGARTKSEASAKVRKPVVVRAYTKEDGTKVPSYTRSFPGEKRKE
jgi:hypothetical protein